MQNQKTAPFVAAALTLAALLLLTVLNSGPGAAASAANLQGELQSEKEYHLKLLAVSSDEEKDGEQEGNGSRQQAQGITADLFLKVSPGAGNVFIETEPVTKLDTRISTRLAKDIACESIGITAKCDATDFFFRIEANASLVGGPSAGAAAAAIAIAAAENSPINSSVAVTGTINSGGLIGNVGGLKEKIAAAAKEGLKLVLIPSGERFIKTGRSNSTPETMDLVEYGKSLGIEVAEVSDIREALFYLTGKTYGQIPENIEISRSYSETMGALADEICSQSANLANLPLRTGSGSTKNETAQSILEAAKNLTSEGMEKKQSQSYYSAASMCFGANVRYGYVRLLQENISTPEALLQINRTHDAITDFEKSITEAKTLAGLQIRGLVRERLEEARELLEQSSASLDKGSYEDGIYQLAFARERLGSAAAWNQFLAQPQQSAQPTQPAQAYNGYEESLREGCITRLHEAEEHMQYLDLYLPGALQSKDELGQAYAYLRQKDHSSCIYRASIAKAKANAMLSALSGSQNLTSLIEKKLEAAKASITRQTNNGEFPIVSYSYYEYAGTLKQSDQPSALLFSEYALELSNLGIYLKKSKSTAATASAQKTARPKITAALATGAIGFAAGIAFALIILAVLAAKKPFAGKKRLMVRARTKAINKK
ncbi:hypothetical protein HYU16_01910 [Candidatus Woesearchaeota archaeon]|nr:hypothetical protein [Candidatus Woesearchaeota archaeon]MBI2550183.1 hypothetical protein [Candidatus Woesearchaeota archaeon]